jgi:hypothetical protein
MFIILKITRIIFINTMLIRKTLHRDLGEKDPRPKSQGPSPKFQGKKL